MTDADFKRTKERVKVAVDRWVECCGLNMWRRVTMHYHRDSVTMAAARGAELSEKSRDVMAAAYTQWQYRQADIHFNLERLESADDGDIDYTVRHEIMHLLVNEMREWQCGNLESSIDHEERVVTELASVMGWVRIAGALDKKGKPRRT